MPESVKQYYLIACAVGKYSLLNIDRIANDSGSPFYCGNSKTSDIDYAATIIADAKGAYHGAYYGIVLGAAGGPGGSALLGVVGGVCAGGVASAISISIGQSINRWINSFF